MQKHGISNRIMEAGFHFKNGASPKSLTGRNELFRKLYYFPILLLLITTTVNGQSVKDFENMIASSQVFWVTEDKPVFRATCTGKVKISKLQNYFSKKNQDKVKEKYGYYLTLEHYVANLDLVSVFYFSSPDYSKQKGAEKMTEKKMVSGKLEPFPFSIRAFEPYRYGFKKGVFTVFEPSFVGYKDLGNGFWMVWVETRKGILGHKENGPVGLINDKGKLLIDPKNSSYCNIENFVNGVALVRTCGAWDEYRKWYGTDGIVYGFINVEGKEIVPAEYSTLVVDQTGMYKFRKNDKVGYFTTDGKIKIPFIYDKLDLCLALKNRQWIYKNTIKALKDGKWGLLDNEGNTLLPFVYKNMEVSLYQNDLVSLQTEDNKWGFFSINAGKITVPPQYDEVNGAYNASGKINVAKNGEWFEMDPASAIIGKSHKEIQVENEKMLKEKENLRRRHIESLRTGQTLLGRKYRHDGGLFEKDHFMAIKAEVVMWNEDKSAIYVKIIKKGVKGGGSDITSSFDLEYMGASTKVMINEHYWINPFNGTDGWTFIAGTAEAINDWPEKVTHYLYPNI
ncbi:MAG: WG repeat-containing protein [Prevotellaceae bacterium]|jgi:hypothetical protein|nr:WG repeat-containing protein [Prevotellaceae bacterium]